MTPLHMLSWFGVLLASAFLAATCTVPQDSATNAALLAATAAASQAPADRDLRANTATAVGSDSAARPRGEAAPGHEARPEQPGGAERIRAASPSLLPADLPPMRLTFADEFDSFRAAPDGRDPRTGRAIWRTTYFWGGRTLQATSKDGVYYVDHTLGVNPFTLRDGVLEISARPASATGTRLRRGLTHTSGLITTKETFSQLYGYFEMRAQLPAVRGFWPAFWMTPVDLSWPPEIDIMEMLGHEPTKIYTSVHTAADGTHRTIGQGVAVEDTSAGFHTYAVSWRPDEIRWYFDGREVFRAPMPADLHKPMYLLANLAVGGPGSWPGMPDAQASGTMRIDYIRAYQFVDLAERPVAGPAATR